MKKRALFILTIFLFSLIPAIPVAAESPVDNSIEDAMALLYISDAVLTIESELEDDPEISGLSAPISFLRPEVDTNPLLARIIHAKKMQRNDLDANCKLLTGQLRAEGRDCEADRIQSYCQTKHSEINSQIGFYHKMQGDQRKFFTKVWHNIKRNASNFWNRIGPLGRNFLRKMGQEAMEIVKSGGNLSGSVLKNMVKQYLKTAARDRIKQVVFQGVERLLQGQLAIAQAAGVNICEDEEENQQTEDKGAELAEEGQTEQGFSLPDSGIWELSCQHTNPEVLEDYPDLTWHITVYWETRSFEGYIEGTSIEIDEDFAQEKIQWDWHEQGSGAVTEDGFFWGDFYDDTTLTVQYGDGNPTVTDYGHEQNWIGAVSEDLSEICFYRVGAQDWFTLDWIRERGRNEMLEPGSGLCEATCPVH